MRGGLRRGPSRIASLLLGGALAVFFTGVAVSAEKPKNVVFESFPEGTGYAMVAKVWMADPEYQDYVTLFQAPPHFSLGMADLNNDGTPELFAMHNDDIYGFCKKSLCRMHIYASTPKGAVEIGRMWTMDPVKVLPEMTKGIKNLAMPGEDGRMHTYLWDGKAYKPQ